MNKHIILILIFYGITSFTFACAMEKQVNGKQNDANENYTNLKETNPSMECVELLQSSQKCLETKPTQLPMLIRCKQNLRYFKNIYDETIQTNDTDTYQKILNVWNENKNTLDAKIYTMFSRVKNIHKGYWQRFGAGYNDSNPQTTLDKFQIPIGFIDITNDENVANESQEVIKRNLLPIDKSKEIDELLIAAREIKNGYQELNNLINPSFFGAQK